MGQSFPIFSRALSLQQRGGGEFPFSQKACHAKPANDIVCRD
jgi:hypothetical protein